MDQCVRNLVSDIRRLMDVAKATSLKMFLSADVNDNNVYTVGIGQKNGNREWRYLYPLLRNVGVTQRGFRDNGAYVYMSTFKIYSNAQGYACVDFDLNSYLGRFMDDYNIETGKHLIQKALSSLRTEKKQES